MVKFCWPIFDTLLVSYKKGGIFVKELDDNEKLGFVDLCLKFLERYPDKAELVSHYLYLDKSNAIEIWYKNGKRTVWDMDSDIEVIVVDGRDG